MYLSLMVIAFAYVMKQDDGEMLSDVIICSARLASSAQKNCSFNQYSFHFLCFQ